MNRRRIDSTSPKKLSAISHDNNCNMSNDQNHSGTGRLTPAMTILSTSIAVSIQRRPWMMTHATDLHLAQAKRSNNKKAHDDDAARDSTNALARSR